MTAYPICHVFRSFAISLKFFTDVNKSIKCVCCYVDGPHNNIQKSNHIFLSRNLHFFHRKNSVPNRVLWCISLSQSAQRHAEEQTSLLCGTHVLCGGKCQVNEIGKNKIVYLFPDRGMYNKTDNLNSQYFRLKLFHYIS